MKGQEIKQHKLFTTTDGLAEREVKDVIRDQEGKFWLLFSSGIQIFDGMNFEEVNVPNTCIINNYKKFDLLKNGDIVLCREGEQDVVRINSHSRTFEKLTKENKNDTRSFYKILHGQLRQVSVRHDSIFISNKIESIDTSNDLFMGQLKSGEQILGLIEYNSVLYILSDQSIVYASIDSKLKFITDQVDSFIGQVAGDLWLKKKYRICTYTPNNKLMCPDSLRFYFAKVDHDLNGHTLVGLSFDPNRLDELWLYDDANGSRNSYQNLIDVENTYISFYGEDFEDRILIGAHQGLWYYNLTHLISCDYIDYKPRKGMFGRVVRTPFYRMKDDKIYFTKEDRGLMTIKKGKVDTILPNLKWPDSFMDNYRLIYNSELDRTYGLHFGTTSEAIFSQYDFQTDTYVEVPLGFDAQVIRNYEDQLWIGGHRQDQGKLWIIDRDSHQELQRFSFPYKIEDLIVVKKQLYLATNNGLIIYDIDSTLNLKYLKSELPKVSLIGLYSTTDAILIGSTDQGLFIRKNEDTLFNVSTASGLPNDFVSCLLIDFHNSYWVGTNKGIAVLDSNYQWVRNISHDDGLYAMEMNRFSACTSPSGHFYFCTTNGICSFHPDTILQAPHLDRAKFTTVSYYEGNQKSSFIADQNTVYEIPYGADSVHLAAKLYGYPYDPYFKKPNSLHSSVSSDVIRTDDEGHILKSIASGNRILNLYSDRSALFNRESSDRIELYMESFLERYRFIVLSSIFSILSLILVFITQRKQIQAQSKLEVSNYQSKINKIKLHALQSQMNPHFIFNSLGSIQYFVQMNDTESADEYLSDFASLMRLILESSKSEFIPIKSEINLLQLYCKLEHLRFDQKFDYHFDIDGDVDMDYMIPPMIIQPFVENAIIHGFQHLGDRKGILKISFNSKKDDHLSCMIQDNGIGRKRSAELRIKKHQSRGMQIVQERISSIDQDSNLKISTETTDLYKNDEARGTQVEVTFNY